MRDVMRTTAPADGGRASLGAKLQRAYVLSVLSVGSFAQCLNWFTFSSVQDTKFRDYYQGVALQDSAMSTVDFQMHLLLNWGPVFGVLAFPLQGWLLTRPDGLRTTVRLGLSLIMLGSIIRLLPSLPSLSAPTAVAVAGSPMLSLCLLHAGQILNAFAGPFVMSCPSRLAVLWFPEDQRAAATAMTATANAMGMTLGFLLGPWLVPTADKYGTLLGTCAVIAFLPWLLAVIHYPSAPAQPPSAAAAAWASGPAAAPDSFLHGVRLVLGNASYGRLILAAGVMAGASAAWQALLQDVLRPAHYTDAFVGYLGFANSLGLNVGCLSAGAAVGKCFQRRFKFVLCLGLLVMLAAGVLWSLVCNSAGAQILLVVLIAALGLGNGVADPLFYELGAELTYPAPEGTSAGILVLIWNLTSFVVIFLPTTLGGAVNWVFIGIIAICLLLVGSVREEYRRPADKDMPQMLPSLGSCDA